MSDDNERWRPPSRRRPEIPQREPDRSPPVFPPPVPPPAPVAAQRDNGNGWRWQDRLREPTVDTLVAVVDPIVRAEGICRDYPMGDTVVHALKPISLEVGRSQFVAVHGRSGSGKTTLLNLIGGLDRPTSGQIWIDKSEVSALPESELVELRRYTIGFIFQAFGLIPILTAAENVEVPLRLANVDVIEREERVRLLLELVGLDERAKHRPHELSGGEQQRVAIARALANSPKLLLADEPTGQLDSRTARGIMELIRSLVRQAGVTAVVATHDPILIDLADRLIELRDGEVIADSGR